MQSILPAWQGKMSFWQKGISAFGWGCWDTAPWEGTLGARLV
jgi:hypothetical protein